MYPNLMTCFLYTAKLDIKKMEFDEILRTAILLVDHFWYDYPGMILFLCLIDITRLYDSDVL